MFMAVVSMAVSAIPEGLPVAFTIGMAIGMQRMARRNAIIRRLPAVETLGSTTTIGSDKTGTLTENRMTVTAIWAGGQLFTVQGDELRSTSGERSFEASAMSEYPALHLTSVGGVLTNEATLYRTVNGMEMQGDPTEKALLKVAADNRIDPGALRTEYESMVEIPFESDRRYSVSYRRRGADIYAFVKGSPERIIELCSHMMTSEGVALLEREQVLAAAHQMGSRSLRVIGVAYQRLQAPPEPESAETPSNLVFLGLQGMMDPPRNGIREAVQRCKEAGMRVVMVTGDHPQTATAIANEVGISSPNARVITGPELDGLLDAQLAEIVAQVAVFARTSPEHKLRIVRALQSQGHVVAVTGDGANDGPALRAADLGIAMGQSGTDVAREASDMVLADDNFVSIVSAVEQGRITFSNLRKVAFFLVSTGAAEVVLILAALSLGLPLPFLPAQLLWLNLVTNGLQDIALSFEPGEPGLLRRPPRPKTEGILSRVLWERVVIAGATMAAGTFLMYYWALQEGRPLDEARTIALTTMVVFQVFHAGNARSDYQSVFKINPLSNRFLLLSALGGMALHIVTLYLPPTQYVLRVVPLAAEDWTRILAVGWLIILTVELHKLLRSRTERRALKPQ
jgi:Ca2+-transporting ATPase